jgi:hypothetical protein
MWKYGTKLHIKDTGHEVEIIALDNSPAAGYYEHSIQS